MLAAGPGLLPAQPAAGYAVAPAASPPPATLGLRLDWFRLPLPFLRPVVLPADGTEFGLARTMTVPIGPLPGMMVQQQPMMMAPLMQAAYAQPAPAMAAQASPCLTAADVDRVTAELLRQKAAVEAKARALEK